MGISDLSYVVLAVGVFHAVAAGLYYVGVRRTPGWWADQRVRALVQRTLVASVVLVAVYLTAALLAFQLLPVDVGYPLFVAAWAVYGVLLMCLFVRSYRRAYQLRAVGPRLAEPGAAADGGV
jgi:hypothetical protein